MSTRTGMNWKLLDAELMKAVVLYTDRKFIKKPALAEWILAHKTDYPNLTRWYIRDGECASERTVIHRITRCTNNLGWIQYSQLVFINPLCIESAIVPLEIPVLQV